MDGHGTPPAGPLWSVPVLGGSPRKLEDIVGQDGAWSADGKLIVYSNGNTLFTAKADGTDERKIITVGDSGFIFNPVWSPDGNHFRFMYRPTLATPSYFMDVSLDGTGLHRPLPGFTNSSRFRVLRPVDCRWEVLHLLEARPNMGVTAKGRFSSLGIKTDSVDFQPDAVVSPGAKHRW